MATLWKNGEPIRLSDGTGNAEARSVYVAGDDVYVAGYMIFGSNPIAVVWKNGTAVPLSTRSSNAGSVYVNGGLVYVAGEEFIKAYTASLWRDGTLAMLSDRYSSAKSV